MRIFSEIKQYLTGKNINKDFEHEKPENWIWGIIYFNKKDYRLLVAKRNPIFGWTFNFAHPITIIVLIFILLIVVAQILYK